MSYHLKKILFILCLCPVFIFAQGNTAIIYGKVTNEYGRPVEGAAIGLMASTKDPFYTTNSGLFEYTVPAGKEITVVIQVIGYVQENIKLTLQPGEKYLLSRQLVPNNKLKLDTFDIEDHSDREKGMTRISPIKASIIPSASGDINTLLLFHGANSRNEMSSTYSVRGGNFDENLVYVNDIEVYRPFLVRAGQQEGLSFVNGDMVSSLLFSAGGFEAKYGDKLSSVLDIRYKRPRSFAGTASGSLLGGNLHLEGCSKDARFTWITGFRYKTNRYILGSLDVQGDYRPSFMDVQTYLTYNLSDVWELGFLGNYASNKYQLIPENRETQFGTINQALRLKVYFDGQEIDQFRTSMGALTLTNRPNDKTQLKFIGSAFSSLEDERFDIMGQYYIDELEADFGKPNFGEVKYSRGVGTFLNHSRNYLDAYVFNVEHKGSYVNGKNELLWGVKYQHEEIIDRLSEWKYLDSAGYSLPYYPLSQIDLQDVLKSTTNLTSSRVMGYVQKIWNKKLKDTSSVNINIGVRSNYWTMNQQNVISPRASISWTPHWKREFLFRAATGFYYQPPFYRELRGFNGVVNTNVKAQQSIHFVLGSDYYFKAWNRKFRFATEAYYKQLNSIVPYEVDNVRIRYFANNNATGYATGLDFKLNGELVKDEESWVSLSFLQSKEDLTDDYYYEYYNSDGEKIIPGYTLNSIKTDSIRFEPGYIPRPTNQLVNFALYFQDHIPRLPQCKVHLSLFFGSALPFGPPTHERYKDTLLMPSYRRVDIGFSYQLIKEGQQLPAKSMFRHLKSAFVSLEVLNLLQVNNVVSYLWIKDVTNRQYAIPNYLTARLINLKLIVKF